MKQVAVVDFETLALVKGALPPVPVGVAIWEPGHSPEYLAFAHASGNNTSIEIAKRRIKDLFDRCRVVAHNAAFDLAVAEQHFGLRPQQFDDTLLLAFLDNPDSPSLGLKELAAARLGAPADEQTGLNRWVADNLSKAKGIKPTARVAEVPGSIAAAYAIGDVVRTRGSTTCCARGSPPPAWTCHTSASSTWCGSRWA